MTVAKGDLAGIVKKIFSFFGLWPIYEVSDPMTLGRIIFSIYALLFLALSSFSGVFFYRTYHEFTNLKKQEAENMRRFAEAEQLLQEQKIFLERLQNDPAFVEREIRQRLGYARPAEVVFRFER